MLTINHAVWDYYRATRDIFKVLHKEAREKWLESKKHNIQLELDFS